MILTFHKSFWVNSFLFKCIVSFFGLKSQQLLSSCFLFLYIQDSKRDKIFKINFCDFCTNLVESCGQLVILCGQMGNIHAFFLQSVSKYIQNEWKSGRNTSPKKVNGCQNPSFTPKGSSTACLRVTWKVTRKKLILRVSLRVGFTLRVRPYAYCFTHKDLRVGIPFYAQA